MCEKGELRPQIDLMRGRWWWMGVAADHGPTCEGLLIELHKVGEDVFRDGLLVRKTLKENDHLCLADSMHPLSRQIPALPVYICGLRNGQTWRHLLDYIRCCNDLADSYIPS